MNSDQMTSNSRNSHQTLTQFRTLFPALANKHYLNFGAQGTLPSQSIEAISNSYHYVQEHGPLNNSMFSWIVKETEKIKVLLAERFGADAESYALTQNATEGCNIALWGIDWKPEETLLITDSEHNGVVAAAKQLKKRRSIKLDYCNISKASSDDEILSIIKAALASKPRAFLFSHVLWNTGRLLPAKEITRLCHEHDCMVIIDGAQSAGVIPFKMEDLNVDFYAFTGHKWICGPEGIGVLYVRKSSLSKIEPTFVGWRSTKYDGSIDPPFLEGASRFEVATAPFPLLSGLAKSLILHDEFADQHSRFQRILDSGSKLRDSIRDLPGLKLLADEPGAGLISFTVAGDISHSDIVKRLEENSKVIVRTIPHPNCIRASVHYFSDPEIDALAEGLKSILTK